MRINETVLEMHYHRPILDAIREVYGLGDDAFNFYKYSPQNEAFVGFDQAFVETELGERELFDLLRDRAQNHEYDIDQFFFGYFLQYKVVKIVNKRSKNTPPQIAVNPHYRADIATRCLPSHDASQHELLFNLSQNANAQVYYACPMLFERTDLYVEPPDLDKLILVNVDSCPSAYTDNASHYIYFEEQDSPAIWCSDPVQGISQSANKWIRQLPGRIHPDEEFQEQVAFLDEVEKMILKARETKDSHFLDLLEDTFTIVEYIGGHA